MKKKKDVVSKVSGGRTKEIAIMVLHILLYIEDPFLAFRNFRLKKLELKFQSELYGSYSKML